MHIDPRETNWRAKKALSRRNMASLPFWVWFGALREDAHRSQQATALRRATGRQFVTENARKLQDQSNSRALESQPLSGKAKPNRSGPLNFVEFDGDYCNRDKTSRASPFKNHSHSG
jgi:hypothetical protein